MTGPAGGRGRRRPQGQPLISADGDLMLWVAVAAPFLVVGLLALISASQYWEARREVQAVAAAAARAGVQPDPLTLRRAVGPDGSAVPIVDHGRALAQAMTVVAAEPGMSLIEVTLSDEVVTTADGGRRPMAAVTVEVEVSIDYLFASLRTDLGLPETVRGRARSVALESGP